MKTGTGATPMVVVMLFSCIAFVVAAAVQAVCLAFVVGAALQATARREPQYAGGEVVSKRNTMIFAGFNQMPAGAQMMRSGDEGGEGCLLKPGHGSRMP